MVMAGKWGGVMFGVTESLDIISIIDENDNNKGINDDGD